MSEVRTLNLVGNPYLAWDSPGGEERRFRILLVLFVLIAFAIGVAVEMTTVPKGDRRAQEKIPERLARLVMEKKKEEPPPPPPPKPEEVKEEKPKEEKPAEAKPEKPTEVQVQKAREVATKAMAEAREELAAMQGLMDDMNFDAQPLTKAGSQAGGSGSRQVLTARAGTGSGGYGVPTGPASSSGGGTGGTKLAAATVAKVDSNIAEGAATGPTRKSASGKMERTEEEVRRVIERSGAALDAIYQRALRTNPNIKGTVVLHLVIAADGSVTKVDLVSSELNDPETEKKILARVKGINFGAIEGAAVWDGNYTLNFFPR